MDLFGAEPEHRARDALEHSQPERKGFAVDLVQLVEIGDNQPTRRQPFCLARTGARRGGKALGPAIARPGAVRALRARRRGRGWQGAYMCEFT